MKLAEETVFYNRDEVCSLWCKKLRLKKQLSIDHMLQHDSLVRSNKEETFNEKKCEERREDYF
jgi:hypothetical protein